MKPSEQVLNSELQRQRAQRYSELRQRAQRYSELRRQRAQRCTLLEALDEKNLAKVAANAQLLRGRKANVPKNNGKGRPAKPLKEISREDEARRLVYVTEIRLLDEILDNKSDLSVLEWLRAAHALEGAADAVSRIRKRKIAKLLDQFSEKPVNLRERQPWLETEVRGFLTIAHQRQTARVKRLAQLPVRTLGEQDCQDRERVYCSVLERILASHRLGSGFEFQSLVNFLKIDVAPLANLNAPENLGNVWRQAVDDIFGKLLQRFELYS
ncbi:MAG TPA: hypothetical protein VJ476_08880 [Rhizomicrobium sp.]|nr:hypothetical protein [Rhizomicrobium sp.]